MSRGGATVHTRARSRLRSLRLLVLIVTAFSLRGSFCSKVGGHQSKTSEEVERNVYLDPKRGDIAPPPPPVAHVEDTRHSSHGRDDQIPAPGQPSSPSRVGSLAGGLDYDLGKDLGLTRGHEVPISVVQSVIQAADQGNRDSLYFLGLLKLYGISVSPDAAKALEFIRKAAELRHLEAMAALGVMLLHGRGGSRDFGAAAAWFRLAATEGHAESMWLLGRQMLLALSAERREVLVESHEGMYYEGKGVGNVDFDEANKWFHRAAATGNARGQHYLGVAHEYGLGVSKDQRRAAQWHSLAATQGLAESNYHLGLMKVYGRGFAQDLSGAVIQFQKGAQQHHAPSMMYLGKMCLFGHGFPVDYDMALLWFERAAMEGTPPVSTEAAAARDELRASLLEAKRVNGNLAAGFDYGVVRR